MEQPIVSVIVPTYNYARYLPRALDSLLKQNDFTPEVIVVDDGSTDNTPEILTSYAPQVLSIRQQNMGVSTARNKGLGIARGAFLGFLDPDDFYYPDKLAKQIALLERHPECGWTYCDCLFAEEVSGKSRLFSEQYQYQSRKALDGPGLFESLFPSNFIAPLSLLVRRGCLQKAGLFDERFAGLEDFDLVLRLAATSLAVYSSNVLATYTWHPGGLGQNWERMAKDKFLILDKVASLYPNRVRTFGPGAKKALADMHNWFAYDLYRKGQLKEAWGRIKASLQTWPLQGRAWLYLAAICFRLTLAK